jgi:cytoskeletal protein CcmA (bactofilin family)
MPLFNREERTPTPPASRGGTAQEPMPPRGTTGSGRTRIAPGLIVRGKLTGNEPVQVDGTVEGDVVVDSQVVVGQGGKVIGRIEARSVLIEGHLDGDLAASEKAEVAASGSTEGDIEAPRVVIAEGAYFKGNVKMGRPSGAGREGGS